MLVFRGVKHKNFQLQKSFFYIFHAKKFKPNKTSSWKTTSAGCGLETPPPWKVVETSRQVRPGLTWGSPSCLVTSQLVYPDSVPQGNWRDSIRKSRDASQWFLTRFFCVRTSEGWDGRWKNMNEKYERSHKSMSTIKIKIFTKRDMWLCCRNEALTVLLAAWTVSVAALAAFPGAWEDATACHASEILYGKDIRPVKPILRRCTQPGLPKISKPWAKSRHTSWKLL